MRCMKKDAFYADDEAVARPATGVLRGGWIAGLALGLLAPLVAGAVQTCKPAIPASTPTGQFVDHGDGTVTDIHTGLMWKQCLEGLSGSGCATGTLLTFTWQGALQQPGVVNGGGGFSGHADWRLPNIKELRSIVEEQCMFPAINLTLFPNDLGSYVWSSSPYAYVSDGAWDVNFDDGSAFFNYGRGGNRAVRLVRGGE